jgi:predicted aspartyl protease
VNIYRRSAVLTLLLLLWLPVPVKTRGAPPSNRSSADGTDGIPIELTHPFGLVLVKAEVNGSPVTLVVDTGSSRTILSAQVVQVRGLALREGVSPSKGSGWDGRAAWIKATVRVGDAEWRDHQFLVMDDLPDISNAVGQKIDGIMGEDIL